MKKEKSIGAIWTPAYRKKYIFRNLRIVKSNLKARWLRGKNGYSYQDIWGFDYYIARIIRDGLRQWIEMKPHGFPTDMYDDDIDIYNPSKEQHEAAFEKWLGILGEIADGFDAAMKIDDLEYMEDSFGNRIEEAKVWKAKEEKLHEKFNNAMDLMKIYFFSLWD